MNESQVEHNSLTVGNCCGVHCCYSIESVSNAASLFCVCFLRHICLLYDIVCGISHCAPPLLSLQPLLGFHQCRSRAHGEMPPCWQPVEAIVLGCSGWAHASSLPHPA